MSSPQRFLNSLPFQSIPKWWEENYEVADLDPVEFRDWNATLMNEGPTILWIAAPMASHHTGMRPSGGSVKLHGAWWKTEPLTDARIRENVLSRHSWTMGIDSSPVFAFTPKTQQQILSTLTKSIDEALNSGMTIDQITALVNTRLVVATMED